MNAIAGGGEATVLPRAAIEVSHFGSYYQRDLRRASPGTLDITGQTKPGV